VNYLLDTDHVTILERGQGMEFATLTANINRHPAGAVGLSVVSFQEQVRGAHNRVNTARTPAELLRGYELMLGVIDLFCQFPVVPFDAPALNVLDLLKPLKIRIGTMDLRIAATALSRSLTLATRNVSDFGKVPGLRTEDWTK
jgi:tRNA(fMet)-specific endonuclease VapC